MRRVRGSRLERRAVRSRDAPFAAEKNPADGYAKLRGTFVWTDANGDENTIGFRIDVDHAMSEGATLAQRMMRAAKFWASEKGCELCRVLAGSASAP